VNIHIYENGVHLARGRRLTQPRFLTGDMVTIQSRVDCQTSCYGMIVGVMAANKCNNHISDVYPYVYYVYMQDGKFKGPLFQNELQGVG
jgi:hypothetical protein